MTDECTLKEMFIVKRLDEFQPDWREGADVTMATKQAIIEYVHEHYKDLIEVLENPECITIKSIENRITSIRAKLRITSNRDYGKKLTEQSKSPPHEGNLDSSGETTKASQEPQPQEREPTTSEEEPAVEPEPDKTAETSNTTQPQLSDSDPEFKCYIGKVQSESECPTANCGWYSPILFPLSPRCLCMDKPEIKCRFGKVQSPRDCPSANCVFYNERNGCDLQYEKPDKSVITKCPCGCGYYYWIEKRKWLSPADIDAKQIVQPQQGA